MPPKYSIMIPSYNGLAYLPSCVSTVIMQDYSDYELIISDDHSIDGTTDYLDTLKHPNITIFHTPYIMSMSEHWEWVLSHSRGEWCIFLGQDDGLLPYFFELADILTDIAEKKQIRTIACERAYYFWPGCEAVYGNTHVSYTAISKISVFSTRKKAFLALCGHMEYFSLPQMYTTSIFNRSIIEEARVHQDGSFLVTHPQDANIAAISCSMEKKYIFSYIPFGWVGSSPKSAGLALNSNINKQLSIDYINKINNSKFNYCGKIGDFKINSCALYFWGALIMTKSLQSKLFRRFINSRLMTYIVIAAGRNGNWKNTKEKYNYVEQINEIKYPLFFIIFYTLKMVNLFFSYAKRVKLKIMKIIFGVINIRYMQDEIKTMNDINSEIKNIITKSNFLKRK